MVRCCRLAAYVLLLAAALPAQPRRIVSTAPSITEILYALGLGDRVAGVTRYCRYPPEAQRKPKIGDYLRPDIEAILALRPDLVITERSGIRQPEQLQRFGIKTVEIGGSTIADIEETIRRIGEAAGTPDRAARLAASMRSELEAIRQRTAGRPRRRVMFVVGRTPGRIEDLVVVGRGSFLNELMEIAGGENIFRDALATYPKVSPEEVLARNPEAIIDMGEMADTVGVTEQQKRAVVALWGRYPSLAAVRNGAVFAVASDIFVVPGPRIVEAAREIARMLHGEMRR